MKTRILMVMAALCFGLTVMAKNIKTVVFNTVPEMHCANCENKIKSNIRFEKGVKDIVTDLKAKTVTVKYDADKTTVDNLVKGFAKIDYQATVCKDAKPACCGNQKCDKKKDGKCDKKSEGCCQKKDGKKSEGCCKKASGQGCCKQK